MITLVILGAVIIMAAFRLRHSPEQRSGWCRALVISAILFVIYAARAAIHGAAAGDCDVRIAVSNDATVR
jgi:hypothetical protein